MPDGDKFYWGVRGAGSRTLLSLARAGAGLELVADQGAKLVTGQLKKPVIRRVLAESLRILEPALPRFETDSSVPLPMADEVHGLFRRLRSNVTSDDFAAVTVRSAEDAYDRLRCSGRALPHSELTQELGHACTNAVLDYAVLDAKRFGLMSAAGRSANDQLAFERGLVSAVYERMASLFDRVLEGRGDESLRAPRRRSPREEFTLERLHAPLATTM